MGFRNDQQLVKWHKRLVEKHPDLEVYIAAGCFDNCFDFSPPQGWYRLVLKLTEALYVEAQRMGLQLNVQQVKEKFGGLRYYIGAGTDGMWDMISKAEKKSLTMCQFCGDRGDQKRSHGWVVTTCGKCSEGDE